MKKKKHSPVSRKRFSDNPGRSFWGNVFRLHADFFRSRLFFESFGIFLLSCSVFITIAMVTIRQDESGHPTSHCGRAGAIFVQFLITNIGVLTVSLPVILAVLGVIFFRYRHIRHKLLRITGFVLFIVMGSVLLSHVMPAAPFWKDLLNSSGGRLGETLAAPVTDAFGRTGTTLLLITFVLISGTFLTGISYYRLLSEACEKTLSAGAAVRMRWIHHKRACQNRAAEKSRKKSELAVRQQPAGGDPVAAPGKSGMPKPSIQGFMKNGVSSEDSVFSGSAPEIHVVDVNNGMPDTLDDSKDEFERETVHSDKAESPYTCSVEYELPDLSLLDDRQADVEKESHDDIIQKSRMLIAKLCEFSVEGRITEVCPGPVITRYEFEPAPGVKISKVIGLSDDLALAMRSRFGLRVAPIPGKSTLGIEIPNLHRETVNLKDILLSEEFQRARENSILSLPLGKDTAGKPFISDLKRMPHLLIAGATGSGKSVCINTILAGLLFVATPAELRLLLIDPKMLELSDFNGIPHLREPVITDTKLAPDALNWAVSEMDRRYLLLSKHGARNIDLFNAKVTAPDYQGDLDPLPYLVIVIDELADLMLTAAATIEDTIQRLSQMARASGIHLIIATQRPSVDVITGVIKANLPCRLAFQVASKVDSRTILDTIGAEKLVGMGDSIFIPPGRSQSIRLHGAYVNENEIRRLVQHLSMQPSVEKDEESIFESIASRDGDLEMIDDPMYEDAVRLVLTSGVASISMLQRRLKVGHSRASRLIDAMELSGIVGPHIGSKTREILVDPDEYLDRLNEIRETDMYE